MSPSPSAPKRVLLGRIGATQGIKGEVRLDSFTFDPLAIAGYGPLETDREGVRVSIAALRRQGDKLIARIEGVDDRNGAEALRGLELFIARGKLPPAEPGEYYLTDLEGLLARDESGRPLGRIAGFHDYGAGLNMEIAPEDGASFLLPFTRAIVRRIDPANAVVEIALPEGFFESGKQEARK